MLRRILLFNMIFLFSLNLLLLAIAKLDPGQFVSDGTVMIHAGQETLQPRYEALAIAKENAILQAVCTFIDPKDLADYYDVLQQTVLKNPQRYISSFKILIEEERGDLLSVKIIARINLAQLQRQLDLLKVDRKKGS